MIDSPLFFNPSKGYPKFWCLLLLLFLLPFGLKATHIVGGEMTYSHISENTYEIQLTVFRDCLNGSPGAPFDNPVAIGLYDKDRTLIDSLFIPFVADDTLNPTLFDECLVIPPSVCVHRSTYRATLNLPPRIGGYELIYQRCCRNVTINNIVNPLATGATFNVVIKDIALLEKNTSPKFKEWPPIYICADEPILFDHSAFDVEGDSIVYRLCTPLDGGTPNNPRPQPLTQTVPKELTWLPPLYSLDNLLNGNAGGTPLAIDPVTGLLTGLPNTIGQFVVGICMDEYRDGVLLSSIRRDFQYNVGECGQTTASFFSPEFQCDSLTVNFDNLSVDADSFLWIFNDPGNPGVMSSDTNPTYTYSDTGLFNVMLIANPGGFCEDTFFRTIHLLPPSLMPDFSFSYEECSDSLVIQITDLTTDDISTPAAWQWTLNQNGIPILYDSVQSPTFAVKDTGALILTLNVTAANGCSKELSLPIPNIIIGNPLVATDTVLCLGESLSLIPEPNPDHIYQWAPGTDITNLNVASQTVMPLSDETYFLTITSNGGFCEVERSIFIHIPDPVILALPPNATTCDPIYEITASSLQAETFLWSLANDFQTIIGDSSTILVEPFGPTEYFVQGIDSFGCQAIDSVIINGEGINIDLPDLPPICPGDTSQLSLIITDPTDLLTYLWSPPDYILDPLTIANPKVLPPGTGTYTYYVDLENQFNCSLQDSLTFVVLDTTSQLSFLSSRQCSGFEIQFFNTSLNAPFILWNFGDPSNPGASSTETNPIYVYPDTGTYQVTLTLDLDLPCKDTLVQTIHVGEPDIISDFDFYFESCGDSVVVVFEDASVSTQSNIISWDWNFSTGVEASGADTILTFYNSQLVTVELKVTSADGCEASVSETIIIRLIDTFLPDTLQICRGESESLNPDGNSTYEYEWSPSDGLDDPLSPNPVANPTQTTTYSVTITDFTPDTCQVIREVTVVVPPDFTFTAGDDIATCDEMVQLTATSNENLNFFWSNDPNFNTILGLGEDFTATSDRPGTYYLRGVDQFGCPKIDTINVYDLGIDVNVEDLTLCTGDSQRLIVENNYPDDLLTFSWSPLEAIVEGANSNSPLVQPTQNTTFIYTVTNQNGCTLRDSAQVILFDFELPLSIFADPDTIVAGESSQLQATPDDSYIYTWLPDATLSAIDISNPVASPLVTTRYILQIENGDRCRNQDTVIVYVVDPLCEEPQIFFPNAFSPNGDGENEELNVLGRYIEEMHLLIYNRWGQKVFETRSQDLSWDGRFNGRLLEPDVFGYYLEVRCINGKEFRKQGNVMLLR